MIKVAVTLAALLNPHSAWLDMGTPDERRACEAEIKRMCSQADDLVSGLKCIGENRRKFSARCDEALKARGL